MKNRKIVLQPLVSLQKSAACTLGRASLLRSQPNFIQPRLGVHFGPHVSVTVRSGASVHHDLSRVKTKQGQGTGARQAGAWHQNLQILVYSGPAHQCGPIYSSSDSSCLKLGCPGGTFKVRLTVCMGSLPPALEPSNGVTPGADASKTS